MSDPYAALGVRPFINCCSVRTIHGGSLMLPEVRDAVAAASRMFVNLDELMEAASTRLAELTGAEWGIVTCGSAAAVALGTAACVAGNDPVKMLRLPFTEGIPKRVILPKNQRFAYDQALRMIGTHIVEVETRAELDAALAEPVAMVCLLGNAEHLSKLRMEEIVSVVKPRGIPILVDAASEHLENPSPWLVRGADLVVYSGGKFLRGPQTSGLLLGRKDLVQAAWRNASPHQALGRPMKVSKEDIVGIVTAVEYWFKRRDAAAERRRWDGDLATITAKIAGIATGTVIPPEGVERVPRLRVSWNAERTGMDGNALRAKLLAGTPRIVLDDMSAKADSIEIEPFGLQPDEAAQVGDAIAVALSANRPATIPAPAAVSVAGDWDLRVRFLHGEQSHRLRLGQSGTTLSGEQSSPAFAGPVEGLLTAEGFQFWFDTDYEGSILRYTFEGTLANDTMTGHIAFGTYNQQHKGAVNLAQFGPGQFTAHRLR
jgi:D-glucosaminate-6-phosphate ammonia-lyase